MPSTVAEGYARARAMLDQPPPHPTSSTRHPGAVKASWITGTPASASPSRCSYQGRFASACASLASSPSSSQPTPPPSR